MKRLFFFLLPVLVLFNFSSCDIDDGVNFEFTALRVIDAEFPEAFEVGETYTINVTYERPDSCTFFEGFDFVEEAQTTRNVAVIGSVLTDEKECAQVIEELETTFRFKVLYSETYLFKFWIGEDQDGKSQYLEIEVPVDQGASN